MVWVEGKQISECNCDPHVGVGIDVFSHDKSHYALVDRGDAIAYQRIQEETHHK